MTSGKPVIVLIPGAFHRPSSWKAVAGSLQDQGFSVLTPPLAVSGDASDPKKLIGKTTFDDIKLIHDVLLPALDKGEEAVIVSHSYGSVSATHAVEGYTVEERAAKGLKGGIKALVTISGFAFPVHGKSIMGDDSEPPVMPYHVLEVCLLLNTPPWPHSRANPPNSPADNRDTGRDNLSSRRCQGTLLQ